MSTPLPRRAFLQSAAAATAATTLTAASRTAVAGANDRITVGVMGLSRGHSLASRFARMDNVETKYVCDTDSQRLSASIKKLVAEGRKTEGVEDFRRILDDKSVDVLVCAAPNHWHAPATILACSAGKHVYVEKPCSHNPAEGEMMVQAARKHNRAVQMGTQRRSGPKFHEAVQLLNEGAIGRVYLAKAWYNNARGTLGTGKQVEPPSHVNYDLWQGPAPRSPYFSNRPVHYNWHWFWHWGNGELGNNGVHSIDICRWGLGVDYPSRVTSNGGRYHYQDDQQTPDTNTVCYEFPGGKQIVWQGLSCQRGSGFVAFYGEKGSMHVESRGEYRILDDRGKEVSNSTKATSGDDEHVIGLLNAIRNDQPRNLHAEIETGHISTLLCHLGNMAYRTGGSVRCGEKGRVVDNEAAMKLWSREYEPGWEPKL